MKEATKLRAAERALLFHPVKILGHSALLVDLSEKGLRLRGLPQDLSLKSGDRVRIEWQPLATLAAESLELRCRWVEGGEAGLSLVNPSARIVHLVRALVRYHRSAA